MGGDDREEDEPGHALADPTLGALTPTPDRKAARNEGRKLAAGFVNNVGVGFFLAGVLQPALAVARSAEAFGLADLFSSVAFSAAGLIFGAIAQAISQRIED